MTSITQIIIFILWITLEKADFLDYDDPIISTTPESSQQSSGINLIKNQLRMLQRQNEKILQQLETISAAPIIVEKCSQTRNYFPKNCKDVQDKGHNTTNVYLIKPDFSRNIFAVVCDMDRRGGGWTYLLNRFDGAEDFDLTWNKYRDGFGTLFGEFWLGLDNIHYLTGYEINELLVELVDFNNTEAYAHYDLFGIGSEEEGYSLKLLGRYDGTAGDSLTFSAKMKFSTKDKDQDTSNDNCASSFGGAWWYQNCMRALLTGEYGDVEPSDTERQKMYWKRFRGFHGLKQARMMVRPRRNRFNPISLHQDIPNIE